MCEKTHNAFGLDDHCFAGKGNEASSHDRLSWETGIMFPRRCRTKFQDNDDNNQVHQQEELYHILLSSHISYTEYSAFIHSFTHSFASPRGSDMLFLSTLLSCDDTEKNERQPWWSHACKSKSRAKMTTTTTNLLNQHYLNVKLRVMKEKQWS